MPFYCIDKGVHLTLERYIDFINKLFENFYDPRRNIPPDLLRDTQRSQLFMDSVDQALDKLPKSRDRQILELRYGLVDGNPHTYKEIGPS